ncbi:hypothetical protein KIH27_08035 [Mycobacterium sp. M1]|uniref:Uncharacterized protein n=1 Tax=Mycolicibacter acidiphilus TaxID=2835306 RepID=A0ABS5RGY8_9MYCO|nr:hypothetical protein [Mycolicibacter acidiphilus]MBS9533536.1 hypothetical protein [Mycolicibacter acidiphilus]
MTDAITWSTIPGPAGAQRIYPAADGVREFAGTSRKVREVSADIVGSQYLDGTVTRSITVGLPHDMASLTAIEARELAAALVAAADEVARLHWVGQ